MLRPRYSFLIPVLAAGFAGGFIGWTVARVGCAGSTCTLFSNVAIGLVSGLVAAAGVGIVVVLADRSLHEWREWKAGAESGAEDDISPGRDETAGEG